MGLISNGNTVFDNGAMASGFGGSMVFVSSATASSSASIEFSLGNYKEYKFFFVNMHPATNNADLQFNLSTDSGSNYNVTKTTTFFQVYHHETNDVDAFLGYVPSQDLAQSTAFQSISFDIGNGADQSMSGSLTLFNPASTTYVKHFISNTNNSGTSVYTQNHYMAGYANTTSALTNIKFQMDSGNIDAGTIYMFGVN